MISEARGQGELAVCPDSFDAVFRENQANCQFALPFLRSTHMRRKILWTLLLVGAGLASAIQISSGQGRGGANPELIANRNATEKELQSVAIVERKMMVRMRDGKRMATDVYRPKDTSKKYPTVF